LVKWSFVELVEEKWPHCYGDKFTKNSTKEKKLRDFKCNFLEKNKLCSSRACLHGNQEKTTIAK